MNFIQNLRDTIKRYNMINVNDRIIVGVSGGADSICLLYCLYILKEEYNIEIVAAHLNHKLRQEAKDDEQFVKDFCDNLNIQVYIEKKDIKKISNEEKISEELAGRQERYDFFFNLKRKLNASKIALAHNKNDLAETMIMRFFRGTGLKGLKGIPPVREDGIIRPLISTDRKSIEDFCKEKGLPFVTDKTNFETKYLRNKVRHNILPIIEENLNANIVNNLYYMAEMFNEDYEYIMNKSEERLPQIVHKKNDEVYVNIDELSKEHICIAKRILRKAYEQIKGYNKDLEYKHIKMLLELIEDKKNGLALDLPGNIICVKEYSNLVLKNKKNNTIENNTYTLEVNDVTHLRDFNLILDTKILDDINNIKENSNSILLDYDQIKDPIIIRSRRDGDKIFPQSMNGSKKLKDYFIDEKIPKSKRDCIPLIIIGNEVIWIVGLRKSRKYTINSNTKNYIYIKARWDNNA